MQLTEPGRMPELFRERIAATIALERFVPLAGERGVTITARRNLDDAGSISWHSTLTRGLTWQTEGVREAADAGHGPIAPGIRPRADRAAKVRSRASR